MTIHELTAYWKKKKRIKLYCLLKTKLNAQLKYLTMEWNKRGGHRENEVITGL